MNSETVELLSQAIDNRKYEILHSRGLANVPIVCDIDPNDDFFEVMDNRQLGLIERIAKSEGITFEEAQILTTDVCESVYSSDWYRARFDLGGNLVKTV